MSRLPVISSSEILTELNNERESSEAGDEDEVDADDGLEVEGLIPVMKKDKPQAWLPDGEIGSLPFLGLCHGGGRGGAIQRKEGSDQILQCIVAEP